MSKMNLNTSVWAKALLGGEKDREARGITRGASEHRARRV